MSPRSIYKYKKINNVISSKIIYKYVHQEHDCHRFETSMIGKHIIVKSERTISSYQNIQLINDYYPLINEENIECLPSK